MVLGFTGTSSGMTQRQLATVVYLFNELQLTELHHSDCVGADAQAHKEAQKMGARVVVHPPSDPKLRAFCKSAGYAGYALLRPLPYLKRNRRIVEDGVDGLIVAPRSAVQPTGWRGEGTWTTMRYGQQAGRRLWIVAPDGTFRAETPAKPGA